MKIVKLKNIMNLNNLCKIILLNLIILGTTAEVYTFSNYEEAYTVANNFFQIAEKLEFNGQFDEALEYYKNSERIFSELNDEANVAIVKSKIGVVYGKKGELDIALKYLQEVREVFHKLNDTQNEIAAIGNSGKIYLLKGELDKSILLFNEAYNLSNKLGDKHGEALALANIGGYYDEKGNNDLGIEYRKKALALFLNTSDSYNAGGQALAIAFEYSGSGDWFEAEKYATQAKTIFESLNYTSGLEDVSLVSGVIFYNKANYNLAFDEFQESIENFYLAEEELKKVIHLPGAKFSYIYVLMREGDLFSRNGSNERAIDKFNEALDVLHGLQFKSSLNKQDLVDLETLLSAKINFEAGLKEAKNLNFAEAAKYFENSENNFKELINASSMVDNKKLISGYFYYSRSEKNSFLFKTTGNEGYRQLSQDDLNKARDLFEEAKFHDLARDVIGEKMVNFPESFIPYKEDKILLEGIVFEKIRFNESMLTSETDYITFNYRYTFKVPYAGLPAVKFCVEEFCSEWIKITDNENRETKIKIWSSAYPRIIDSDIKIYSENRPEISIGKIDDSNYWPSFSIEPNFQNNTLTLEFVSLDEYNKVSINIDKPFSEKVKDILKLPQIILSIIVGLLTLSGIIYKKRNSIKNALKSIYHKIRNFVKKTYLFSWDKIPGNDNERLIEFLEQKYGIAWLKTAKIKKTDNNRIIRVSTKKILLR